MERKLFCVSVIVSLISTVAVALPSRGWTASSWTTEPSHRSGWEKTEAKYADAWKQAVSEDSQGKGWVSSESAKESKPKAIPTSWQQVDRHHGGSVRSSGWTNVRQKAAINPPSQDIANGIVVHHPIPSSSSWNQSPFPIESWNKQNAEQFWQEDENTKSASPPAAWEKAVADAEKQWHQNQTPDIPKSSWDTSKSAWEKSPDASSAAPLWNKNSPTSGWESDAINNRESAAGYAATGPAQYGHQESGNDGWQQEKPSNNGWPKTSPPTDALKKDPTPSTLYDSPSKWNSKATSGNSDWQKTSNGWASSSDFKTWQKETNGWTNSASNVQDHPAVSGWQQGISDVTTQKLWQEESIPSTWHKSASAVTNDWDKHGSR